MLAFENNGAITQCPIGVADLQRRFPSISFSTPLNAVDLQDYGVVEVEQTTPPEVDRNEEVIDGYDYVFSDGKWRQAWTIRQLTSKEKAERLAFEAANARAKRNQLLSGSDWTQLPDAPGNTSLWAAYRQALRDITNQAGFPQEIEWPEEPA